MDNKTITEIADNIELKLRKFYSKHPEAINGLDKKQVERFIKTQVWVSLGTCVIFTKLIMDTIKKCNGGGKK